MLSEERADFEKSNEELVARCDQLQTNLDTRTARCTELERDYEELSLKVEAENDAQQEWEQKTAKKAENFRKERAKLLDTLEVEKNRVRNLEAKVDSLKDTTVQGEMQKQIETLRAELGNYKTELEASLLDKEQIEVDLENVYRALEDANDRQEERLMEAIAKERQQLKTFEAQVDEAKIHEKEGEALVSARSDPNPFAFLTSSLLSSISFALRSPRQVRRAREAEGRARDPPQPGGRLERGLRGGARTEGRRQVPEETEGGH